MLNRGFGTSLFNMVPKGRASDVHDKTSFGTSLFDMVPKVSSVLIVMFICFETNLVDMIPKGRPATFEDKGL